MAGDIHPGSWIGDSVEEFKKLPTWGKFAVAGGLILAIFLFLRMRSRAAASASNASTAASPTTDTSMGSMGSAGASSSSPFPMVGNTPVLPSNVNPIYDPSGGLVGFQQSPTPSPVPTTTGNAPGPTTPGGVLPNRADGAPVPGNFPTYQAYIDAFYKWAGTPVPTGLQGYNYGTPTATTGPVISPTLPVTPPTHTGSPPPQPRPVPQPPKLQTYTVVHGDSLSGIAARLHYQGGWQALYTKNIAVVGPNPNLIFPGQKLTL